MSLKSVVNMLVLFIAPFYSTVEEVQIFVAGVPKIDWIPGLKL